MKTILTIIAAILLLPATLSAQILYKIEGNGLEKPSYLFGTHHLAPLKTLDKFPQIKQIMDQTEAVCGEIDMTQNKMLMAMAMQQYMMAPEDSTLQALVPADRLAELNEKFLPHSPQQGVNLYNMGMMKPMVLTSLVSLDVISKSMPDFNPEEQLDSYFQNEAVKNGKQIIPLETPEMQARLLYCSTPISSQLKDFEKALDNPDEMLLTAKRLNEAYANQDLQEMITLSHDEHSDAAFLDALLTQRNLDWSRQLPAIMQEHPTLIAVGALHLAGDDGLVALLRKAGFTVEAVK